MKGIVAVCVLCSVALTGCGGSRSVLYSGVSFGISQKRTVITDAAALREGRQARREWIADIDGRARQNRDARFSNLAPATFRRRLAAAAARYRFTVETVRFLRPRQLAPLVVVRTRRYVAFSRAVPAIERSLDPGAGSAQAAFEGLFLEGEDERGVPFVIVTNAVRGTLEGGQWARSDALYPFAHG